MSAKVTRAYQHLNIFWNGRSRAGKANEALSSEELRTYSAFPLELNEFICLLPNPAADLPNQVSLSEIDEVIKGFGEVNLRYAAHHLGEPITGLCPILAQVSCRATEPEPGNHLEIRVAHVYQHLNWFWNGQRRRDRMAIHLTDMEFNDFSSFPVEVYDQMDLGNQ